MNVARRAGAACRDEARTTRARSSCSAVIPAELHSSRAVQHLDRRVAAPAAGASAARSSGSSRRRRVRARRRRATGRRPGDRVRRDGVPVEVVDGRLAAGSVRSGLRTHAVGSVDGSTASLGDARGRGAGADLAARGAAGRRERGRRRPVRRTTRPWDRRRRARCAARGGRRRGRRRLDRPGVVDRAVSSRSRMTRSGRKFSRCSRRMTLQPLDVAVVELAVARRRPLGLDQALALEEADLGDRDVGELLEQQAEHLADRQVRPLVHAGRHGAATPSREEHQPELADLQLVALVQRRLVDPLLVHVRAVQRPGVADDVARRRRARPRRGGARR